ASSPSVGHYGHGTVYQTFLNRPPCNATRSGLDGEVVALTAGFGKVRWRTRIGPSESSPLLANGLVYVGDWRGKVYALDAVTGRIRWSFQTGGAVKDAIALSGHRLFFGSYDRTFYALDAATGDVGWRFAANGPISGSATVIDGIVYFATLKQRTYGLDARTGHRVWAFPDGKYTPVVADRKRLYLIGRSAV